MSSTDASPEQLATRLEQVEDSLATALARIEAMRNRNRMLMQESQMLRKLLKEAGVRNLPAMPGSRARDAGASETSAAPEAEELHPFAYGSDGHPIFVWTPEGKLPGSILVTPTSLEFVELRARVLPAEFVGIRTVQRSSAGETQQEQDPTKTPAHSRPSSAGSVVRLPPQVQGLEGPAPPQQECDAEASGEAPLPRIRHRLESYLRQSWAAGNGAEAPSPLPAAAQTGFQPAESGVWEVLWKAGGGTGPLCRLTFEASTVTRTFMHRVVEEWSCAASAAGSSHAPPPATAAQHATAGEVRADATAPSPEAAMAAGVAAMAQAPSAAQNAAPQVAVPVHITPGTYMPDMTEPSAILSANHLLTLAAAVPARFRQCHWTLIYSTTQHGISLQTLYRRAAGHHPTILVVRDSAGFIFGCFAPESWRMAPRYYGSGESFVFQLERLKDGPRNDFFQFSQTDCLAIGGGGAFAVWLDGDLLRGHSGLCQTFGSPCLAAHPEFNISRLELYMLH